MVAKAHSMSLFDREGNSKKKKKFKSPSNVMFSNLSKVCVDTNAVTVSSHNAVMQT